MLAEQEPCPGKRQSRGLMPCKKERDRFVSKQRVRHRPSSVMFPSEYGEAGLFGGSCLRVGAHNASVSSIDAACVHDFRIMIAHGFRHFPKL
jgi:hypothetical protein